MKYEAAHTYAQATENGLYDNIFDYLAELKKFHPELTPQLERIEDYIVFGDYAGAARGLRKLAGDDTVSENQLEW